VTLSSSARADLFNFGDAPRRVFAVGPSVAYGDRTGGEGLVYGLDATYSPIRPFWLGVGFRSFENLERPDRDLLPYAEAGVWFVLNLGGGYTFDVDSSARNMSGPHFFAGLPIPIVGWDAASKGLLLYAEPYYRGTFGQDGQLHEFGVMVKWIWSAMMKL
jgi:hypothetical protein